MKVLCFPGRSIDFRVEFGNDPQTLIVGRVWGERSHRRSPAKSVALFREHSKGLG
jgi:hypothetical protein